MRESKLQDLTFHRKLSWGIMYVSPIVFLILLIFKPSTYGKLHQPKRNFFGPLVSAKWCWTVFESPNWVWVLICFYSNYSTLLTTDGLPNLILLVWFFVHYVHRSLIYPLSMSSESKFPIGILGATIPYCVVNG